MKAAEIGSRKYVMFDEDCAGFGLGVYPSERKTFVLIYPRSRPATAADHRHMAKSGL